MIFQDSFEQKIGFDKIRALVKDNCLCEIGKDLTDLMIFLTDYNSVHQQILLTDEMLRLIESDAEFPTNYFYDMRDSLLRIKIEGLFLDVNELFDLRRSLDTIRSILHFIRSKPVEEYPELRKLTHDIAVFPLIAERINKIINKDGEIRDNASNELQQIRRDISTKQMTITKRIHSILKQAQSEGWIDSDVSATIRDGKLLIPVPASHKRRIKGVVHDESATGKTAYIEPADIVEANNDLRELEFAERREIIRILVEFATILRPYLPDIIDSYYFLGTIDFIRAKARFAKSIKAIKPPVFNPQPTLHWFYAIHPLLYISHLRDNKQVVPLNIRITDTDRIVLISGPNAGGKSVCLKTVGLLQYMFQCGLLVPVSADSEMGLFEQIFIDIGDEQSIENDLSTYSSHLYNMKFFDENADAQTLILIDEFGSGTEPAVGAAIAESLLESFNNKKVKGVVTTHYTNLKLFASKTEGIANAAMLFDSKEMRPLYQLEIGLPGSSFAFEIARSIGLPANILQQASMKVGQAHIDYEEQLREIEKDRRALNSQQKMLEQKEARVDKMVENFNREINYNLQERKSIIARAKEEAKQMLAEANKQIEKTIFEIRKSQADKEKTKEVRQELDDFKKEFEKSQEVKVEKIDRKLESLQQKHDAHLELRTTTVEIAKPVKKQKFDPTIRIGDKVRIKDQEAICEVIGFKGENIEIAYGQIKTALPEKQLVKISNDDWLSQQRKRKNPYHAIEQDISNRKLLFSAKLDIRGQRADEALNTVSHYIDEAIMVQQREVRILHGTGNGILRQIVRNYLRSVNVVQQVRDEHVEFGGSGITVVTLEV